VKRTRLRSPFAGKGATHDGAAGGAPLQGVVLRRVLLEPKGAVGREERAEHRRDVLRASREGLADLLRGDPHDEADAARVGLIAVVRGDRIRREGVELARIASVVELEVHVAVRGHDVERLPRAVRGDGVEVRATVGLRRRLLVVGAADEAAGKEEGGQGREAHHPVRRGRRQG